MVESVQVKGTNVHNLLVFIVSRIVFVLCVLCFVFFFSLNIWLLNVILRFLLN